jgi:hypothetical protein
MQNQSAEDIMEITNHAFWALVHGMGFGAAFLLAFAGGLAGLYSLRPELVTAEGITERTSRLRIGTIVMAVLVWATVLVGTYIVYPWYRANPPEGLDQTAQSEQLAQYPKFFLLAAENTADWHTFGMEWKEHVAWISPLLATAVAYAVYRYGNQLSKNKSARMMLIALFLIAFAIAGVAGMLGALITKAAPV